MTSTVTTPPWQLGAVEAAALVQSGALSPLELVDSVLERISDLDGDLAAWATVDEAGARVQARRIGARLARRDPVGALAGVPIGIKDVIDVAGMPTTASSAVLDRIPAPADAPCVDGLRRAGAIILGKLHTAEFACADPAPTFNPWDRERTPGGSSAGSGVAVASGTATAALGTQTGGSTLRPALYNGVVGLKPTYGMIPNRGVIPVSWSFDHVGILARSVTDAAALLAATAGHDPADPSSDPFADHFRQPVLAGGRSPVIGVVSGSIYGGADAAVAAHTAEVAAAFEGAGARIRELRLPPSAERIAATVQPIFRAEMFTYHRPLLATRRDRYRPKNLALLDEGASVLAADYVEAVRARPVIVAELELALRGVDIALTPGTPAAAPKDRTGTGDASFQQPWSFAGLPAVALPTGVSRDGVPLGIQLVGHRWGDAALLQAARWCEEVLGFDAHPPCWSQAAVDR